jgi:hypothetical protein
MHLLFVDESGTPPRRGHTSPRYFVIGGIVIPEDTWHSLRDALMGMKIRRKIRGELKWRYFAPGNVEMANPMRNQTQDIRDEIRREVYRIIARERGVKTLAAVCSIEAVYAIPGIDEQQGIYNLTYKAVTERFQYFLQDLQREIGMPKYGMIISDHRGRDDDKKLRAHHQMLIHSSSAYTSTYNHFVESLLLQPSNLSIGIQLADMVAGAVWRKFERNDTRWFDLIEPSLRRSRAGNIDGYGIVKVPKAGWI